MFRRVARVTLVGAFVTAGGLVSLGCGNGGEGSSEPGATGGSGTGGQPTATGGAAGAGTAGAGACDLGAVDDPDPEGVDSNCDGFDGIADQDIYVDGAALYGDRADGTAQKPVASLEAAFILAAARAAEGSTVRILVTGGTYDAAELDAHVGGAWSLHGGYADADFKGARVATDSVLEVGPRGLYLDDVDVLLDTLFVLSADGDGDSPTSHGIRTRAAQVLLRDVHVSAGSGQPGAAGEEGELGASGPAGSRGAPGECTPVATSGAGAVAGTCPGAISSAAQNGAAAGEVSGDGRAAGYITPSGSGTAAYAGRAGAPGSSGLSAPATASIVSGLLTAAAGLAAPHDAKPGFGGAGGGSYCTSPFVTTPWQLYGGGGGVGGCPGAPGGGGQAGGGSVAVLVLDGAVTIEGGYFSTAGGGNGGGGGPGGPGGPGGRGGTPLLAGVSTVDTLDLENPCTASSDQFRCAAWGGKGGVGGDGGRGGGGAGGWSVGVLAVGTGMVEVDVNAEFAVAAAGTGGSGPLGAGASGTRKTISEGEVAVE